MLGQQHQSQSLNKLIKKVGSVLGTALEPLVLVVKRRTPHKLVNVKNTDCCHCVETTECDQFETSSAPLQKRKIQEVLPVVKVYNENF